MTCQSIIDPVGSYEWRPKRAVLGVVAAPPAYIPQTVRGEGRWPYWSKVGLVVRADIEVLYRSPDGLRVDGAMLMQRVQHGNHQMFGIDFKESS